MKGKLFIGTLAVSAMTVAANAATVTDDFSGTTLNAMWQVNDSAGSYNTGGGAALNGSGEYMIHYPYAEGASNISTSMGTIGASDSARLDANVRSEQYNAGRWSNEVAIWFDNENWVGLRPTNEGGLNGYGSQGVQGGTQWTMDTAYPMPSEMRWRHVFVGIELTPTLIKFYATPIVSGSEDMTGVTDVDSNVTLLGSIARPASFVGQAYAIVGKGYAYSNGSPAYLNNNGGTTVVNNDNYIDYVRIITPDPVPEPTAMGLLAVAGLSALGRRHRRA